MIKKLLAMGIAFLILIGTASAAALAAPNTYASAVALYEPITGTFLYESNSNKRMLIASTTKIMTALVVIEHCDLDEEIVITEEYATVEGSAMPLKAGDTVKVRTLLYGLMLASGNNAAVALACHTAGSIEAFAYLMNAKVRELGLKNTHFTNPHGLDDDRHYSSAHDLAIIASAALDNEVFAEIVSTKSINVEGMSLKNHNKLLWICRGAIGVKTGYTMSAGRTLVSCVERYGVRLICVTLNDGNDWNDHISLYNWGYGALDVETMTYPEYKNGSHAVEKPDFCRMMKRYR